MKVERQEPDTYEEFIEIYKARYNKTVPNGLYKWFQFAKENKSKNLNNYDNFYATLAQFQGSDKKELSRNIKKIPRRDPFATFRVKDGNLQFPPVSENKHIWHREEIAELFLRIKELLPDMEFTVNLDDREALLGPSVLQSIEEKQESLNRFSDMKWSILTKNCPNQLIGSTSLKLDRPSIDVCKHLNSSIFIRQREGELLQTVKAITDLIPIFSWSKWSSSRDFLIPIFDYSSSVTRNWISEDDPLPYDQKNDTIFWRASSTGSSLSKDLWRANHRIQVGRYFNDIRATLTRLEGSGRVLDQTDLLDLNLEDTEDNRKILTRLRPSNFDAGLSRIVQCQGSDGGDADCSTISRYVPLMKSATGASPERESKIVFDMDGNSMSGRYYRLLESNSLVFKQTLLAEWHDDFLIPWYHYIPVDGTSLQHIPQLVDFFLNDRNGKKIAAKIAENGRRAAKTMLRKEDFSIYWARILLEYHSEFM